MTGTIIWCDSNGLGFINCDSGEDVPFRSLDNNPEKLIGLRVEFNLIVSAANVKVIQKVNCSTPAPIKIIGTIGGVVVAEDRTDSNWKAEQIAAAWRESGMEVEVVEKISQ